MGIYFAEDEKDKMMREISDLINKYIRNNTKDGKRILVSVGVNGNFGQTNEEMGANAIWFHLENRENE